MSNPLGPPDTVIQAELDLYHTILTSATHDKFPLAPSDSVQGRPMISLLGMIDGCAFNPSTQEVEAGGLL